MVARRIGLVGLRNALAQSNFKDLVSSSVIAQLSAFNWYVNVGHRSIISRSESLSLTITYVQVFDNGFQDFVDIDDPTELREKDRISISINEIAKAETSSPAAPEKYRVSPKTPITTVYGGASGKRFSEFCSIAFLKSFEVTLLQ